MYKKIAVALLTLMLLPSAVLAQNVPVRGAKPSPAQSAQATPQPAAPAQPPAPTRTEIQNFDNWSVTCNEFAEPAKRTVCSASLQVVQGQSRQVVFVWSVGVTPDKKIAGAIVTPTGVILASGIQLKLGNGGVRKVSYATCEPARCTASVAMDDAFIKEAGVAASAEATIQAVDGRNIKFSFPMKGLDKAVAALRR